MLDIWGHERTVTKLERRKDLKNEVEEEEKKKNLWSEERNETSEGNK